MKSRLSLFLFVGSAACFLAGCNVAPDYHVPETSLTPGFKEAVTGDIKPEGGWKLANPDDQQSRGPWWEIYGDATLNDLEKKVADSNQSVIAADARYREARALVVGARGALLPTLSATPSVIRSRSSSVETSRTSTVDNGTASSGPTGTTATGNGSGQPVTRTVYSLPVDASYEFDLWHRIRNTIAQNADTAQSSAADLANVLLSTQAELAQDYFQVRALDEQRRILQATLADYQASLTIVNSLFQSGMASDEDLSRAKTQLNSAQAQETDLAITRAQYEHAIAVLIGLPPAKFALAIGRFSPRLPAIPIILPSELLERRPDVASAERKVAAANAGIGIARAAYFPTLSLNASGGFESTQALHLLDWPNRFWSIGPQLAETIFDGGVRRALSERAKATYDETVADYRQTVLGAFQSVEDSLSTLRFLDEEAGQQQGAVTSALDAVKLSVTRYQNGMDSYVNVVTAQNAFLSSREAELQVRLRALTASVGLVKNLGGGWSGKQLPSLAFAAKVHPTRPGAKDGSPLAAPNPPPLPPPVKTPEELLREDESNSGAHP